MAEAVDKIGVVRQHRWMSADEQAELLKARCRKIVSLGGGKLQQADLDQLVTLARDDTVIEFVHAFLLADPRRKKAKGGLQADFRAALARIEKRGAAVVDVDGQVCSQKHRRALLALVDADLARSNRGAKSATNGARSRGRQAADFTDAEMKEAKAVWRNVKDYPEWDDAAGALPEGFTVHRAYKLWGSRK